MAKTWADMTQAERLAHSIRNGTNWQNTKEFDPAVMQQAMQINSAMETQDTASNLLDSVQNPGGVKEAPWDQYGFASEAGYNQFTNNWDGKFDINTGEINQDWWDSLSPSEQKSTWYDITSGGIGISNPELSGAVRDSIHSTYVAGLEPSSTGGLTFGGSNLSDPASSGPSAAVASNAAQPPQAVVDAAAAGSQEAQQVLNDYYNIGRSGEYENPYGWAAPERDDSIDSYLTNKSWEDMSEVERVAHSMMRGSDYYREADPEVYAQAQEFLEGGLGNLEAESWFARMEAIDRVRDRNDGTGVSIEDALSRAGFQGGIEGYDAFADLVSQNMVDWDGDINWDNPNWTQASVDEYLTGGLDAFGNSDLQSYIYNQLGEYEAPETTGPNEPWDPGDSVTGTPPFGYEGGYDWNWDDFQPGAPSLDGGGGYDPNDYAFDRYVPGQESPWGIPDIEGGNKDFYRNQFINLLKDEQNFQARQDMARTNRDIMDAVKYGGDKPEGMSDEEWASWGDYMAPQAMDWSWLEGGAESLQPELMENGYAQPINGLNLEDRGYQQGGAAYFWNPTTGKWSGNPAQAGNNIDINNINTSDIPNNY